MAADEVLLASAALGIASLRFYCWSQPTLSLGYFQPEAVRRSHPSLAALPFVRRPSGGATLIHHHELTYALALPPGPAWQDRPATWLCRTHRLIAAALQRLGVEAQPVQCHTESGAQVLCFHKHTPGDLAIGPAKVVGSAQRRHRGALLQHGAILLAASPHAPQLQGIAELTGKRISPDILEQSVIEEFLRETSCDVQPGDWTGAELQQIAHLAATKYATDAWNCKR